MYSIQREAELNQKKRLKYRRSKGRSMEQSGSSIDPETWSNECDRRNLRSFEASGLAIWLQRQWIR
eukprot:scaffold4520_cov86-Pinguiococcus_pyrenoidosus.AAC.1